MVVAGSSGSGGGAESDLDCFIDGRRQCISEYLLVGIVPIVLEDLDGAVNVLQRIEHTVDVVG
jgi:hypothetical protein